MTHIFEQPMLSLSPQSIYRIPDVDIDDLSAMWNVFTKCKAHLENGQRLENMSWRLWYHERQQSIHQQQRTDYFSYIPAHPSSLPNSSLTSSTASSSGDSACSTSIKRFLSTLSPGHDVWSQQSTVTSSSNINENCPGSVHVVAADAHPPNNNHESMAVNNSPPFSAHTTDVVLTEQTSNKGSSESHGRQTQQQHLPQPQDIYHPVSAAATLRQPVKQSVPIIVDDYDDDEDEDEDDYDEEECGCDDDDDHFKKTEPHRPSPRPSLLSTMLQQRQQAAMRSTPTAMLTPSYTLHSNSRASQVAPSEHFLRKELSESLRRNVLWEHIQQRTLYHRNVTHRRPKRQNENNPADHDSNGWQESFQGW